MHRAMNEWDLHRGGALIYTCVSLSTPSAPDARSAIGARWGSSTGMIEHLPGPVLRRAVWPRRAWRCWRMQGRPLCRAVTSVLRGGALVGGAPGFEKRSFASSSQNGVSARLRPPSATGDAEPPASPA